MEIKNFPCLPHEKTLRFRTSLWVRTKLPQLRSHKMTLIGLIFSFSMVAIAGKFFYQVDQWAETSPHFNIDSANLSIKELPDWITPYVREIAPVGISDGLSLFSPDLTQKLACAYLKNPWVQEVREISKKYPNHVSATLILRRPVAWIHHCERYLLSDARGVCLADCPQPVGTSPSLPVITGVEGDVPRPGKEWQDPSLKEAVRLADYLNKEGIFDNFTLPRIEIRKCDWSPAADEPAKNIVLITHNSLPVIWGRNSLFPPVSPEERLNALRQFYQMAELPAGMKKISAVDIRFGYAIIRTKGQKW